MSLQAPTKVKIKANTEGRVPVVMGLAVNVGDEVEVPKYVADLLVRRGTATIVKPKGKKGSK